MTDRRCVIVGDVVHSREVQDRESLSERLRRGIEGANEAVGSALVADFAALKGVDEVGGVLSTPTVAYRAMREIAEAIHPAEIRFAVVWDDIDIGTGADDVAKMDGPAFHEADSQLSSLGDAGRYVAVAVSGAADWLVALIRNQMDLLFLWKRGWTVDQAAVVRRYRALGSMAAVADERDVSVQAVSQMLARAEAERIMAVEADLEDALAGAWGDLA